jgi:hypothetical protein
LNYSVINPTENCMSTNENRNATTHRGDRSDSNRDPISGPLGSHPIGSGLGAVAGGAVGLGLGAAVGGPIGAAIGATVGAVAGGVGGKGLVEGLDPMAEESHWRSNYRSRPYVGPNEPFELYLPAYRFGWEQRSRVSSQVAGRFDDVERDLSAAWDSVKHTTSLTWEKARDAIRDAWDRFSVDRAENEGMPPQRESVAPGRTGETKPNRS